MSFEIADVRVNPGDSGFLVYDENVAILYDTGFAFTGYKLAENIKNILKERKLDYIFLTHSHYDHALGSAYVKKCYPDTKVVAGEYASKIFLKDSAKKVMRELDKSFAHKCGVTEYQDLTDSLSVDIAVKDGNIIKAGNKTFEVISLPGHTRCSVAFYCREEKLLLSCETIGVFDGINDVVPSCLVGYEMTLDSIEKVKKLEIENILIPHFGLLDKDKTKLYLEKAKESLVSTKDFIVDMLKEEKTKEEIIETFKERFYNDYVKEVYPVDAMELNTGIMIDLIKREFEL